MQQMITELITYILIQTDQRKTGISLFNIKQDKQQSCMYDIHTLV